MCSETEIREVIEKYEASQWKSVADLSEDRDEDERLLLCVRECVEDCDGVMHMVKHTVTGTVYSTRLQVIALSDEGEEYEGEDILGWRPIPLFPNSDIPDYDPNV